MTPFRNGNVECSTSTNNVEESCNAGEAEDEEAPPTDIVITNVVCTFSVGCKLDLAKIAKVSVNVEYKPGAGMLTMKINKPYSTANIWSSGIVTCTGTTKEEEAKIAARRFARILERLGHDVKFSNYRVVNVKGTCVMPFAIDIINFCKSHPEADYEPEMRIGVIYKIEDLKATLVIFPTGKVIVFASCIPNVQTAIEYIFQLLFDFRKEYFHDKMSVHAPAKRMRYTK